MPGFDSADFALVVQGAKRSRGNADFLSEFVNIVELAIAHTCQVIRVHSMVRNGEKPKPKN